MGQLVFETLRLAAQLRGMESEQPPEASGVVTLAVVTAAPVQS